MSAPPHFSLITATYQAARFIPRCHWSLLQQQVSDWEWIVVDDASTDQTSEVIRSLRDDRIRYFRFEVNKGRGPARNHALEQARGDWSVILDMDDFCFPDRLSRAQEAKNSGYDFLCSPLVLIDDDYRISGVRCFRNAGYPKEFTHATLCGATHLLKKIGYPPFRRAQDVTIVLTVANNHNGYYCPDPLYIYHETANARLSDAFQGQYYFLRQLHDLVKRKTLRFTFSVWCMQLARVAKLAGLLPLFLYPPLYKKTLKWRNNATGTSATSLAPERVEYIQRCARIYPLKKQ